MSATVSQELGDGKEMARNFAQRIHEVCRCLNSSVTQVLHLAALQFLPSRSIF